MGYTHYWNRPLTIEQDAFNRIVNDFTKLLPELEEKGVKLADGFGEDAPVINADQVWINGAIKCGHAPNTDLSIPWPTSDAGGVMESAAPVGGWFAGSTINTRTCNGECSYETFYFPRIMEKPEWGEPDEHGRYFNCCKTAFRPYDLAVTAFLVIAKNHLGEGVSVSSDGESQHWFDAKLLCNLVLGYGLDVRLDFEAAHSSP